MNKHINYLLPRWIWLIAGLIVLLIGGFTWRYYYLQGMVEVSGYRVSRVVAEATSSYAAGNLSEAKVVYHSCLKNHANDVFAWNGLANVYRDEHNYLEAETAYLKAINIDRRFEQGYRNIYTLYLLWADQDTAQLSKAEAVLLDGLKNNPESISVLEDLVSYYTKISDLTKVSEYQDQITKLHVVS